MLGEDGLELICTPSEVRAAFDLNALLELKDPAVFMFRLKSAAFAAEGLLPGDFVLVRRDITPRLNDLLAVYLEGRWQLLRYSEDNFRALERSRLFGVVTGSFRSRRKVSAQQGRSVSG